MPSTIKNLSLSDLILRRRGTITFRIILGIFGIALRLFFRRIETINADSVPRGTGVIFVMNHPNGLIDPALVFVALPRKISFLAKSTLFRMPVIAFLLRTVEALPLYRRIDAGEDISKNLETFTITHELLGRGGSIALFPEGVSHNSPKLLPIKTGAARIALGAVSVEGQDPIELKILPVGLYYTSKTTFRSEALLYFGDAFTVTPAKLDPDGQPAKDDVRSLTARIEDALREVTLNAETESELHMAHIAEEIFASAGESETLGDRHDFLKRFLRAPEADDRPAANAELIDKIRDFDTRLDSFGIEPTHLYLSQFSRGFVIWQAILRTWYMVLLLPFAVIGTVLHFPAYQAGKYAAMIYARHGADDVVSTVKVLAGIVFMPLTWIAAAVAVYFYFGWIWALASLPFWFICGYAALFLWEQFEESRGWVNAIWLFLSRRERFLRLYVELRELQEKLGPL